MILQPKKTRLGLVDNGVIGTGLYGTSVQSESGSLAFPLADALADAPAPWDETSAFASASKFRRLRLVTASRRP
jgi:hypothetical protein